MATVAANVRTYLVAQSSVTDVVSTRVYFGNIPNLNTLPSVAIEMLTEDTVRSINGGDEGLYNATLQIDVVADTYTSANAAGEAIRAALDDYRGTMGAMECRKCYVTSVRDTQYAPIDASDTFRHMRQIDVDLWHE